MFSKTNTLMAVLAIAIAAATVATPSSAQSRPPGTARERVIHDCSLANQKYGGSWATTQVARYRACMAEHGEVE